MDKKSFAIGFAIASGLFLSTNLFALGGKVQAYLCDTYKIEVDGMEIKLPDGMRILNYVDRTYTPARLIAEAMGGEVSWDDANKTIKIKKPAPKVVEKVVEKIVEVPSEDKKKFQRVPLKLNKRGFILEVTGIDTEDNLTYVYLDAENKSGEGVEVDYSNAKIKTDKGVYETNVMSGTDWGDSIDVGEKREGKVMVFSGIETSNKEIELTIPVKSIQTNNYDKVFEYDIKIK